MSDYLWVKHSITKTQSSKLPQQSILDILTRSLFTNASSISRLRMLLEEAILAWIINTLQPFVIVEDPSF
jgi:hypothetical protein